jgi:hypothetical protein
VGAAAGRFGAYPPPPPQQQQQPLPPQSPRPPLPAPRPGAAAPPPPHPGPYGGYPGGPAPFPPLPQQQQPPPPPPPPRQGGALAQPQSPAPYRPELAAASYGHDASLRAAPQAGFAAHAGDGHWNGGGGGGGGYERDGERDRDRDRRDYGDRDRRDYGDRDRRDYGDRDRERREYGDRGGPPRGARHPGFVRTANQEGVPSGLVRVASTVLFLGGVPPNTPQQKLADFFSEFGAALSVRFVDANAFVTFQRRSEAERAAAHASQERFSGTRMGVGWGRGPQIAREALNSANGEMLLAADFVERSGAETEDVSVPLMVLRRPKRDFDRGGPDPSPPPHAPRGAPDMALSFLSSLGGPDAPPKRSRFSNE